MTAFPLILSLHSLYFIFSSTSFASSSWRRRNRPFDNSLSSAVARVGFSQSSFTTVEEAGTAVLVVNSNGANPDPVIVGYTVDERNTQGICRD